VPLQLQDRDADEEGDDEGEDEGGAERGPRVEGERLAAVQVRARDEEVEARQRRDRAGAAPGREVDGGRGRSARRTP